MKVSEFLKKHCTTQKEMQICISVYKDAEKSEEEWEKELKTRIIFSSPKTSKKEAKSQTDTEAPKEETKEAPERKIDKEAAKKKIEEKLNNK